VLGRIHLDACRTQVAIEFCRKAVAIREQHCLSFPGNSQLASDCAGSYHRLGEALLAAGRQPEAIVAGLRGLASLRRMTSVDLGESEYHRLVRQQTGQLVWLLRTALSWTV
jgi:hypothetical protein